MGPGRGIIDRKKEAEGSAIDRAGGVSNLEIDCAEQGRDWEEVVWQEKREMEQRRAYGLPIVGEPQTATGNAGGGNDEDDPDSADARETAGAER
jgi:capsid protein